MAEILQFPKQKNQESTSTISTPRPTLVDATAAFTFSRLPREQRIAATLFEILKQLGGPLENGQVESPADMIDISSELAKYSVKDFAVRYGHLEPNAKA